MEASEGTALRRPSDLRREIGPRRSARGSEPAASWPEGFAASVADRSALVILLHCASLTARHLLDLARVNRTASSCLRAVLEGDAASDADRVRAGAMVERDMLSLITGCGARLVAVGDPEYPPELLDLEDPPAGLFVRGLPLTELVPRVTVVGARNCSATGRDVALVLSRALGLAGVVVVSGGARGIDATAHRGALRAGGRTICVLGCGIDVLYPGQNRALFEDILNSGALVSEYPPGTPAEPFRFPARNRIVAGLSRAVVVVEGAIGSGSMITAEHAIDLGRDVFAVPGSLTNPLAAVPLALLRDGAGLVRSPEDLLGDLGLPTRATGQSSEAGSFTGPELAVWEALTSAMAADSLAAACGLSLPDVVSALVGLELRGSVRQTGGRYERRLEGSA